MSYRGGVSRRPRSVSVRGLLAIAAMIAPGVLPGCGASDGLQRQPVSGRVTLDGQPLARGMIQFLPESNDQPTMGGTTLQDGAYSIPRHQGLVPGKYRVLISSPASEPKPFKTTEPAAFGAPPPVYGYGGSIEDIVPAEYNVASTLSIEVKAGSKEPFNFELKGRATSGGSSARTK